MGRRCARGAQALGINENLIHQWKQVARESQSNAELEIEVDKLRRHLKQVEMERTP
jgi:transposase-like protein